MAGGSPVCGIEMEIAMIVNRKTINHVYAVLTAGLLAAALGGCGGAEDKGMAAYEMAATDTAAYESGGGIYTNEAVEEKVYEDETAAQEENADPEVPEEAVSDRKLIKNVTLNVETEQFDVLLPTIEQKVTALGGYIEELSSFSRSNEYAKDYQGTKYLRCASMTVRIPRENLELFLEEVGQQTNVTSRSESVTDVTLQYVDLESHKKALLTEQDRLLELLEQAESVEDIVTIEGRLSEVRYQIESMEAQLRTYDNKIDYSTVYLSVDEVEHYSPTEATTMGERIRSGFLKSMEGVGKGIQNTAIWFVINIPYLFVWAVVIVIITVAVRFIMKRQEKKNAGRKRQRENPYNPYTPTHAKPAEEQKMAGEQHKIQEDEQTEQDKKDEQ